MNIFSFKFVYHIKVSTENHILTRKV